MASKRHLELLDPVVFNKRPRLEMEPTSGFPASLCKSSLASNPGSENPLNYKGSYFACPLQTPGSPEQPLAHWNLTATYLHYGTSGGSQSLPAEGLLPGCLLYRLECLGAEKGKESLGQELFLAPGHSFPVKQLVAVNRAAPLAVPRPVYRAPTCFLDPRLTLPLGPRLERPGDAEWALPAATPASKPLNSTGLHKGGPNPNLLPLHPSLAMPAKEEVDSPATLSPYYATFEKYRAPLGSPPVPEQRKVSEVPSLSSDPWPSLQERLPVCYPHTHYPLPLQKAAPLLYPHPAPPMEAQPSALPGAYKGFVGNREPFPGSDLKPQAPRSYFTSPLDTLVPKGSAVGPVASPRDAESPRLVSFLPNSNFAVSAGDANGFNTSFPSTESNFEQHQVESPQQPASPRHSSAFQPIYNPKKLPIGSSVLTETFPKGEGGWMKPNWGEQGPPYSPGRRRVSPAPQQTPSGGVPAPIMVQKGDACRLKDAVKNLVPPLLAMCPLEGLNDRRDDEASPSSPPMPVIHNVFSLAPYRDYLEGTGGSAWLPFCREQLQGGSSPQNPGISQEPSLTRDPLAVPSLRELRTGQGDGGKCYSRAHGKPQLVPQDPESRQGSPCGTGSGELGPEDMVLDLSLKKTLMKGGEMQALPGHGEEKEDPGGKAEVGEGTKSQVLPLLLEVTSGDKSSFQSSATFMFKKFKMLRSLPPSAVFAHQAGSLSNSQPSPGPPAPSSSDPTPLPPPPPQTTSPSPPASSSVVPQPSASTPQGACSALQLPPMPEVLHMQGNKGDPGPQTSAGQYFITLHTWLCDVISCSVSRSSPELLWQWLKKAEPAEEPGEMPKKAKDSTWMPESRKPPKGKEIWLAFQDVATLLPSLLSQLETFMFACKCPFPHVVRAGAIFIPIHVVKEKLFPKLPGTSVDQVLQEHKVELRPTTLSEEKHLRDLELKSCTSRMLKLLALKQLPDIYPDLLNLHWHNSIRQQLGWSLQAGQHPSK